MNIPQELNEKATQAFMDKIRKYVDEQVKKTAEECEREKENKNE